MIKCDFCSASDVTWSYPAHPMAIIQDGRVMWASEGPWAACDRCHALLEKDAYPELGVRAVMSHPMLKTVGMSYIVESVHMIHDAFRVARCGPAERVVVGEAVKATQPGPRVVQ